MLFSLDFLSSLEAVRKCSICSLQGKTFSKSPDTEELLSWSTFVNWSLNTVLFMSPFNLRNFSLKYKLLCNVVVGSVVVTCNILWQRWEQEPEWRRSQEPATRACLPRTYQVNQVWGHHCRLMDQSNGLARPWCCDSHRNINPGSSNINPQDYMITCY